MRAGTVASALALLFLFAAADGLRAQGAECGFAKDDWCPAPAGDPCGRHKNAAECRADFSCRAVTYRGPTEIACLTDRRGFSLNCPAVGCRSINAPDTGSKP